MLLKEGLEVFEIIPSRPRENSAFKDRRHGHAGLIDFPRVRSDKGSLSPGPQPSSYPLPKLFKLLCKEPGREEGNPNPGCLEFCQERITRQQVGPRCARGRRARAPAAPAPAPAARRLHRPTWAAPRLFCAPAAECNKSSEISRILARGRCLCSARGTAQPTDRANEPAPLRAIPANGIYCPTDRPLTRPPARPAGLERGGLCNGLRPSVGTHSGFRSSSSSSIQHVPYTNTNAAVKRWPAPRRG